VQQLLQWKTNKYYVFRDCVFVALGIQHAMRMPHTVIGSLSRSTNVFPHYLIKGTIFVKKTFTAHKM